RPAGARAGGAGAGQGRARDDVRRRRDRRRRVDRGDLVTGRRAARRTALFLLYQWDLTGQPLASLYEGDVDPFAPALAREVAERAPELDARTDRVAEGWTAERMGVLERNILRMGIHEL